MPAKLTHKQYVDKVHMTHGGDVKVIGKYVSTSTKIKHRCTACANEWLDNPELVLSNLAKFVKSLRLNND